MGDVQFKPGHYWDWRECGWVRYATAEPVVPVQAEPVEDVISDDVEVDAPAG